MNGSSLRRRFVCTLALAWLWPSAVFADDAEALLDEALAHYRAAALQDALATLDELEASASLSEQTLTSVYAQRALVHHGLDHSDERDGDLLRLAVLSPTAELPLEAPPALRQRFAEQRALSKAAPLQPTLVYEHGADGLFVRALASGEDGGLVRLARVEVQRGEAPQRGEEGWRTLSSDRPPAPEPGEVIRCRAVLVGPGGVVLRRSEGAPVPAVSAAAQGTAAAQPAQRPETDTRTVNAAGETPWWLVGVVGAGALVGIGFAAAGAGAIWWSVALDNRDTVLRGPVGAP